MKRNDGKADAGCSESEGMPSAAAAAPAGPAKARKGDLVLIERTTADYVIGQPRTERTEYTYGVVASVDKNGLVKTYSDHVDGSYPHPLMRGEKATVGAQEKVDVAGVIAASKQHTFPNSDTPMPFRSVEDAKAILKPHVGDQAEKLKAARAAAPKGRDPLRLKVGDRVLIDAGRGEKITAQVTGEPSAFEENRYNRGVRVPMRVLDGPSAGREGTHTFKKSDKAQVLPPVEQPEELPAGSTDHRTRRTTEIAEENPMPNQATVTSEAAR